MSRRSVHGDSTSAERIARAVEQKRKDPDLTTQQLRERFHLDGRKLLAALREAGLHTKPTGMSMRGLSRSKAEARQARYRRERKAGVR